MGKKADALARHILHGCLLDAIADIEASRRLGRGDLANQYWSDVAEARLKAIEYRDRAEARLKQFRAALCDFAGLPPVPVGVVDDYRVGLLDVPEEGY